MNQPIFGNNAWPQIASPTPFGATNNATQFSFQPQQQQQQPFTWGTTLQQQPLQNNPFAPQQQQQPQTTLNMFGQQQKPQQQQPLASFQMQQPPQQQQQLTTESVMNCLNYLAQSLTQVQQNQQQLQTSLQSRQNMAFPTTVVPPPNPILFQTPAPYGYPSSFALMDGYRPTWTPNGISVCLLPDQHQQRYFKNQTLKDYYPTNLNCELDLDIGVAFKRGYELGIGRYSPDMVTGSRVPSRQIGSTSLADPYYSKSRPYTSPVLSSPSSTSIFFGAERNPELKNRTLSWRKGYGGRYPFDSHHHESSYYKSPFDSKKYDYVADDMFSKKNCYADDYSLHRKWKKLGESEVNNSMRNRYNNNESFFNNTSSWSSSGKDSTYSSPPHQSSYKPRNRVRFYDPFDDKYFNTTRRGPPIKSHMDDEDLVLYQRLWESSNFRKEPITVANLPYRFPKEPTAADELKKSSWYYSPPPPRSILKNPSSKPDPPLEERDSPVFFTYKNTDQSIKETPLSRNDSSGSVVELYNAKNRPKKPCIDNILDL